MDTDTHKYGDSFCTVSTPYNENNTTYKLSNIELIVDNWKISYYCQYMGNPETNRET